MSTHKYFDRICCVALVFALLLTGFMMYAESLGVSKVTAAVGYENRLFDTERVHTIDIVMDDWDGFLATCENEEYTLCSVIIDGEAFTGVGIRAKGNTSLSNVSSMDSDRYSFKLEFDQYDAAKSYYGLDKLCLNNIIQDNTYMKDYLTYRMMAQFGVAAPLCSYAKISVNGEVFGLYLAVEAVEDSFLQRNYGSDYGELYKPDSMDMGGGRGNGMDFDFNAWESQREDSAERTESQNLPENETFDRSQFGKDRGNFDPSQFGNQPGGKGQGGMGSSDVSLVYTDDSYDSYQNIFDNAKTNLTDADKDRLIASLKAINEQSGLTDAVEIEQVIRYFVVHNFVVNFDSYTGSMIHNYYLYEQDGKLSMIPWDYNLAFGSFQSASDATGLVNYPIDSPISGGTVESRPMFAWILSDESYTAQYHALFTEFLEQVDLLGMIEQTEALIAPYVKEDPTAFCSYEAFELGADTLHQFCALRIESIEGQLSGSIGSTSETQQQDTLIDADDLQIADMGSMGNRGQNNDRFRMGVGNDTAADTAVSLGAQMQPPGDRGQMPEGFDLNRMPSGEVPSVPEGFDPNGIPSEETSSAVESAPNQTMPEQNNFRSEQQGNVASDGALGEVGLVLLSIVVLIGGLIFAKFYRVR